MTLVRFRLLGLALSILTSNALAADVDPKGLEFFEKRIRPVLVSKCYQCHSERSKQVKGGLLLDTRAGMRRGGESGAAVVPNDIDSSLIIEVLKHEFVEMPPDEMLPKSVIADFEAWIKLGAPDPRDGKSSLLKREIDFVEGRKFWAFQLPKVTAPKSDSKWARDSIDNFVLDGLNEKKLKPVADSDSLTLLRRLYFDLVGLPSTLAQIEAFEAAAKNDRDAALKAFVAELLESPHFGEHWGRHWLDVARYAESNGRERNYLYPFAYRYRNWVISALNEDKPYDQFIREQLAGDLLPSDDVKHRESLQIATGFLAIGPKLLNERNSEVFLMDIVDEQIDVTTRSTMALTVSCARCHDHKFDPIPTQDYYSVAGIFRSTKTLYGSGGGKSRQRGGLIALTSLQKSKPADSSIPATDPNKETVQKMAALQKRVKVLKAVLQSKSPAKSKNNKKQNATQTKKQPATAAEKTAARKELAQVQRQLVQLRKKSKKRKPSAVPANPHQAMGVAEGSAKDCNVLIRGEVANKGDVVERGYVTILSPAEAPKVSSDGSGRLELANWIVSRENPLTSRVIVNRVWSHLFGQGLVRTVDNFGATGAKPTHPELLDTLAVEFMDDGWSIKRLIRRLVLTRTYQLSTNFDADNFEVDPDNQSLWRMNPRRLGAESLRDAMLLASGDLDRTPAKASVVAKFRDTQGIGRGITAEQLNEPNKHRSVYLGIVRNAVPEALKVFDFAEPSILVGRRNVTTVPAQALYMLNNEFVIECSNNAAKQLLAIADMDDGDRINKAYQLILSRPAAADEIARAEKYLAQTNQKLSNDLSDEELQRTTWSGLCQALFACAEFRYLD